jgi:hypothetical protein
MMSCEIRYLVLKSNSILSQVFRDSPVSPAAVCSSACCSYALATTVSDRTERRTPAVNRSRTSANANSRTSHIVREYACALLCHHGDQIYYRNLDCSDASKQMKSRKSQQPDDPQSCLICKHSSNAALVSCPMCPSTRSLEHFAQARDCDFWGQGGDFLDIHVHQQLLTFKFERKCVQWVVHMKYVHWVADLPVPGPAEPVPDHRGVGGWGRRLRARRRRCRRRRRRRLTSAASADIQKDNKSGY